jgi:hypothetical protein
MREPELDERQRAAAARFIAVIDLNPADGPLSLPELREISTDRLVLGDVLGGG